MRVRYLDIARSDMIWFRYYYRSVFPEGRPHATAQFKRTLSNLLANPKLGKALERGDAREHSILRTPFAFIYRLDGNELQILRVWDQRSDPQTSGFHEEGAEFA